MLNVVYHKYTNDESCRKVRNHCHYTGKYRGVVLSICILKYSIPKKILWCFTSDQNMIIIKKLLENFQEEFNSLGENNEKWKAFSILVMKEVKKIDKMEKKL